jgi:uncharacterized cupin superfamily protein
MGTETYDHSRFQGRGMIAARNHIQDRTTMRVRQYGEDSGLARDLGLDSFGSGYPDDAPAAQSRMGSVEDVVDQQLDVTTALHERHQVMEATVEKLAEKLAETTERLTAMSQEATFFRQRADARAQEQQQATERMFNDFGMHMQGLLSNVVQQLGNQAHGQGQLHGRRTLTNGNVPPLGTGSWLNTPQEWDVARKEQERFDVIQGLNSTTDQMKGGTKTPGRGGIAVGARGTRGLESSTPQQNELQTSPQGLKTYRPTLALQLRFLTVLTVMFNRLHIQDQDQQHPGVTSWMMCVQLNHAINRTMQSVSFRNAALSLLGFSQSSYSTILQSSFMTIQNSAAVLVLLVGMAMFGRVLFTFRDLPRSFMYFCGNSTPKHEEAGRSSRSVVPKCFKSSGMIPWIHWIPCILLWISPTTLAEKGGTSNRPIAMFENVLPEAVYGSHSSTNNAGRTGAEGGFLRSRSVAPKEQRTCGIDVINAAVLDEITFSKKYYNKKPLLIRGGASNWAAQVKWTKQFLKNHGVINAIDGVVEDLLKQLGRVEPPKTMPRGRNEPLNYLFRRLDQKKGTIKVIWANEAHVPSYNILNDISPVPQWFKWNRASEYADDVPSVEHFLSIGGEGTGLSFHRHDNAWNGLVWGTKQWLLYQSEDEKHHTFLETWNGTRQDFLNDIWPSLPQNQRPLQCYQEKGDLIYIPNGTTHAVWNKGETVAVSSINHSSINHSSITPPKTTIKRIGLTKTPVVVMDQVLSPTHFLAMEKKLRGHTNFLDSEAYDDIHFPGRIAPLDDATVAPLLAALSSPEINNIYPRSLFSKREHVRGFASILCKPGWVHSDDMGLRDHSMNAVSPAAVFYFGFPKTKSIADNMNTGTAFYREKISGLERLSSVDRNQTDHCDKYPTSIVCWNNVHHETKDSSPANYPFEEIERIEGHSNRLILYPKDIFHNAWVTLKGPETLPDPPLSCSATTGRLAISLFFSFSSINKRPEPVHAFDIGGGNDGDSEWKVKAIHMLSMTIAKRPFPKNGLPVQSHERGETRESPSKSRRILAGCATFTKGETINVVGVQSCSLSMTTTVRQGEILKVQGVSNLIHPELNRGGTANGESDVFDRHFVVIGDGLLTLNNLKLSGAWVGNTKTGFCDACGYWYVLFFDFTT